MKLFIEQNKKIIMICFGVLVILLISITFAVHEYKSKNLNENNNEEKISFNTQNEKDETVSDSFYVEIKGAVKKPGVYEMQTGQMINDLIKKAGGIKSTGYTDNINLSKKLTEEMVIYIYTKNEYKKLNAKVIDSSPEKVIENTCVTNNEIIDNCTKNSMSIIETKTNDTNANQENNNISSNDTTSVINNKNESSNSTESNTNLVNINTADINLLTSLSGIGEAKAKKIIEYRTVNGLFKNIEDIKKVSGIGDGLYEQIKNNITV